jgi:hypothetical protein
MKNEECIVLYVEDREMGIDVHGDQPIEDNLVEDNPVKDNLDTEYRSSGRIRKLLSV